MDPLQQANASAPEVSEAIKGFKFQPGDLTNSSPKLLNSSIAHILDPILASFSPDLPSTVPQISFGANTKRVKTCEPKRARFMPAGDDSDQAYATITNKEEVDKLGCIENSVPQFAPMPHSPLLKPVTMESAVPAQKEKMKVPNPDDSDQVDGSDPTGKKMQAPVPARRVKREATKLKTMNGDEPVDPAANLKKKDSASPPKKLMLKMKLPNPANRQTESTASPNSTLRSKPNYRDEHFPSPNHQGPNIRLKHSNMQPSVPGKPERLAGKNPMMGTESPSTTDKKTDRLIPHKLKLRSPTPEDEDERLAEVLSQLKVMNSPLKSHKTVSIDTPIESARGIKKDEKDEVSYAITSLHQNRNDMVFTVGKEIDKGNVSYNPHKKILTTAGTATPDRYGVAVKSEEEAESEVDYKHKPRDSDTKSGWNAHDDRINDFDTSPFHKATKPKENPKITLIKREIKEESEDEEPFCWGPEIGDGVEHSEDFGGVYLDGRGMA